VKTISIGQVKSVAGPLLRVPDTEDGETATREATTKDVIQITVFNLPRDQLTTQGTIHVARLFKQMDDSPDGVLKIEEAEYDWLRAMLDKDQVGPRIWGINLQPVIDSLKPQESED